MDQKSRFSCITPLMKQCWVTLGVSLHMSQMGMVIGFSSVLVPQLKLPDSSIPIDDDSGSWIASFPAISIMIGNLLVPSIMGKLGRKLANIIILLVFFVGWICLALSPNVTFLLATRCLQGISMGMIATLGPLLIGEYTSPSKRGAFLMSISVFIAFGVMTIQLLGSYFYWKIAAFICIGFTILVFLIVLSSPESPSWLADQERYEKCRATFRWLRGDEEEEELEKLIASSMALKQAKLNVKTSTDSFKMRLKNKMRFYGQTIMKNEFYKPFVIMIHIYAMGHWSGINLLAAYAVDFIVMVVGEDVDLPTTMLSMNLVRLICNAFALILIQKVKRRTLMFSAVGLNVCILFLIAVYTFNDAHKIIQLGSYSYYIGISLLYLLTFSIAIGALPLSFILAGEIFPLKYKSIAGGFSSLFFSLNLFVNIKTVPFLIDNINVYGMYLLYCVFLIYFLIVVGVMLPETKDKTLQEIEEEFVGGGKEKCVCNAKV